jgi:hypothetical protein
MVWKERLLRPIRKNATVKPAAKILDVKVEQRNAKASKITASRKMRKRQAVNPSGTVSPLIQSTPTMLRERSRWVAAITAAAPKNFPVIYTDLEIGLLKIA